MCVEGGGGWGCLFANELVNEERNSTLHPKAPVFKELWQVAGQGIILIETFQVV